MADRILVTGGAGYIGSHACKALAAAGYVPVTYDNLCTGWAEAVKFGPFEQGDLLDRARALDLQRVFCLTFETEFFARHGFRVIEGTPVEQDVYSELLRSHDDGVAEFLDLARVKPNTLGNTRMLLQLR